LVTFRCDTPEELEKGMGPMMEALASTKGLIQKTFIGSSPQDLGGFYLFSTPEAAEAYLSGEFFTQFKSIPIVQNVTVKQFRVEDEPSKMLGTPSTPLADSAAAE